MSSQDHFDAVRRLGIAAKIVFCTVACLSLALLVITADWFVSTSQPVLVVLSIAGVVLGAWVRIEQTAGNEDLRLSQLTNAFNVPLGADPREGYFNNPLDPSVIRLAVTTLENTKFTAAILKKMLIRKRFAVLAYISVFVLLLALRHTSLGLITIVSQTIFSGDIVLDLILTERFRSRTVKSRERLRSHFASAQPGVDARTNTAVFLAAFADYECAKDEAAVALDSKIYRTLNPKLSAEWQQEIEQLGILKTWTSIETKEH